MQKIELIIDGKIIKKEITTSDKVILPVKEGTIGPFKYRQHPTDPLAVEDLQLEVMGDNKVKIKMRMTGRVQVDNFPDPKMGGTKLDVLTEPSLENGKLCFRKLEITHLDVPNVLSLFDDLIRQVANQNLPEEICEDFLTK